MRRLALACIAFAAGFLWQPPAPAVAQQVINACVVNSAGVVMRTRFIYVDWQGTRHESAWQNNAIGGRHCARLQDLRRLTVEVYYVVFTADNFICRRVIEPVRTVTIQVSGTAYDARCDVLG